MMQKYTNGTEIRYFEDDVNVEDWIDLTQYHLMTALEIDQHEHPLKYMSDAEKQSLKRENLAPLTKRQFNFYLRDIGLLDQVRQMLAQDLDAQLEYESVFEIYRDSPTVTNMTQMLNLTEEQVDAMWEEALNI